MFVVSACSVGSDQCFVSPVRRRACRVTAVSPYATPPVMRGRVVCECADPVIVMWDIHVHRRADRVSGSPHVSGRRGEGSVPRCGAVLSHTAARDEPNAWAAEDPTERMSISHLRRARRLRTPGQLLLTRPPPLCAQSSDASLLFGAQRRSTPILRRAPCRIALCSRCWRSCCSCCSCCSSCRPHRCIRTIGA